MLVDQFEELFTLAGQSDQDAAGTAARPDAEKQQADRQAFIDNLLYAATIEDGPVLVILTMRADFCGKCAQYPSLANAVSSHQTLVGPMTEFQLREAILRPAELTRARFDPGLADLLVREVREEPGALPLLQFALRKLWERQDVAEDDQRFTVEAYRDIGGLRGALEDHANGVLRSLGGDPERDLCRRILLRLVQPGEGAADTKRRVPWSEILPDAAERALAEKIIQRLADERLIVTEDEFVEIAHEALIRDWKEIARWIDADRTGLRIQRRLTEAAEEWAHSHADPGRRDAGLLYQGTPLALAREWAEKHPRELSRLESEFLDASTRLEEARQQRELDNARRLAEEAEARRQAETTRAQEAEAASQRLKKLALVAGAVAVVALISSGLVIWQWGELEKKNKEQMAVLVQATVIAPDDDFPAAVKRLWEYRDDALEPLRRVLRDANTTKRQKANAALALVAFGEELNMLRPALGLASDPAVRTRFIHHYARFRGDLREAAQALESVKTDRDPAAADFRSGLCAALGQISWDDMQPEERDALRATMLALYRESPDGGTHSAAYYALNRWGQQTAIPTLPKTPKPWTGRGWAVNSLGTTMIHIPAGMFRRGDDSHLASFEEKPLREVTLADGFFMSDRPVTVRQFRQFVDRVPNDPHCKTEAEIVMGWSLDDDVSPDEDCPVQSIGWFEAVAFCNWLSHQERLTPRYRLSKAGDEGWQCEFDPRANGYRLPSEAEWEYACRAKSQGQYTFGDAEELLGEYAWYEMNSHGRTWPAGQKLPNGWGLFDMHGNVWEWCEDVWHDNYEGAPLDGSARVDQAAGSRRVYRGGGWAGLARFCRCAFRGRWHPVRRSHYLGFRFVLASSFNEGIRAFP